MKDFFRKWGKFLGIIFSPGSIVPLVIATVCLYFAFTKQGTSLSVVLSIIASILTAISGFFIRDDWDKMRGDSVLEKKGRSAIRNLDSISRQIRQIREWIKLFIDQKQLSKRELEEIDRHLGTMEMNTGAGMQDWVDIVPELKKTAEVARTYEEVVRIYIEEILKNKKELLVVGMNQQLKKELEGKIKDLEKKVKELKREQSVVLGSGFIGSGLGVSAAVDSSPDIASYASLYNHSSIFSSKICSQCGKQYKEDLSSSSPLTLYNRDLCPECKAKINSALVSSK